jgi:hypothetical protein
MTNAAGQVIANTESSKISITSSKSIAATTLIWNLVEAGAVNTNITWAESNDVANSFWRNDGGGTLMTSGYLWFVRNSGRWTETMWGEENTKYGYVPWPMPDTYTLADYKIALGGTAGDVMPIGRDYSGYGDDCTAENIYWAYVLMMQKTKEYYYGSDSYDRDTALQTVAAKYAHSEASQAAYIYIANQIEAGNGFYDPLTVNDNPIDSSYTNSTTGLTTIKAAVQAYCTTRSVDTWADAVVSLKPILEESMRKNYS